MVHLNKKTERVKIMVAVFLLMAFLFYSAYIYVNLPSGRIYSNPEVTRGKTVWQKYNCQACHQVYGLGGFLGPDLTNVYSKRGRDFIHAFLRSGSPVMPVFKLTSEEMNDLSAFLRNIDSSGTADPRTFKLSIDGTIHQDK